VLDDLLSLLGGGSSTAIYNVDSCLAEVEDLLSYCNDILSAGINPDLARLADLEYCYQSDILVPAMILWCHRHTYLAFFMLFVL